MKSRTTAVGTNVATGGVPGEEEPSGRVHSTELESDGLGVDLDGLVDLGWAPIFFKFHAACCESGEI
jgi:hypothetical protein